MASFKECIDFTYYAICLSFDKIEFGNYQITALGYKNHTQLVSMLIMNAAIFFELSLKIVRFNGALRQTAKA